MKQLTLRGFDDDLRERLELLARERGISLNKAAILLLRRGAGLTGRPGGAATVGESLDDFIGSWGADDEKRLLESIDVLEQVDGSLWK